MLTTFNVVVVGFALSFRCVIAAFEEKRVLERPEREKVLETRLLGRLFQPASLCAFDPMSVRGVRNRGYEDYCVFKCGTMDGIVLNFGEVQK